MPKKEKNGNPNPMPDPNPKSSGLWVNLRLSEVTIVVAFFGSPLLFGSGFPSANIQIQNVNQNFAGEKPISTSATPKPMPLTLKD